jgi:hypothetical protein
MPNMGMPGQPAVVTWPWPGWLGTGSGMPGFAGIYELTRFDGPETAAPGDVTLKATGGAYDGCANDYEAKASVQSGTMAIRLSVSARAANRQCFASGHEDNHTFAFPLRIDSPGTYAVMGQTTNGDYRQLGSLTVSSGTTSGDAYVYEFTRYDGPLTTTTGTPTTVKATGGTYAFCDYAFAGSARIDAQNRYLDLSWIGTPHPPGQPRCLAMAQANHTQAFEVTFAQAGLYTVRTQTANGWRAIGSIAAN